MKNTLPVERHEDERRILIEWIVDFNIRAAKVVIAKDKCTVGEHYHKNKDEIFYLLKGKGSVVLDGKKESLKEGEIVYVGRDSKHSFTLDKDSILLGGCSKPFDPKDDYA